jgi:hypothetical protein
MNRRNLFLGLLGVTLLPAVQQRKEITVVVEGVVTPGAAVAIAQALEDVFDDRQAIVTDWSGTELPAGLSLDRKTGIISGLPVGARQPQVLVRLKGR